jgi:hypothetical protein
VNNRNIADRWRRSYDPFMQALIVAVAGATVMLSAPALALAQKDYDDEESRVVLTNQGKRTVHREGEYGGVQPGVRGEGTKKCGKRSNRVSWIGFQEKTAGASRVFVQMCGELPHSQEVVGNKLVVTLEGAKYLTRNARRRLDTRYFDTAIRQVSSKSQARRRARNHFVQEFDRRAAGLGLDVGRRRRLHLPVPRLRSVEPAGQGQGARR